jgi:hypothetical protein
LQDAILSAQARRSGFKGLFKKISRVRMEAGLIRTYTRDIDDRFREFSVSRPRRLEEPSADLISISQLFRSSSLRSFNVWIRRFNAWIITYKAWTGRLTKCYHQVNRVASCLRGIDPMHFSGHNRVESSRKAPHK